jgi:hypothetical protein
LQVANTDDQAVRKYIPIHTITSENSNLQLKPCLLIYGATALIHILPACLATIQRGVDRLVKECLYIV